MTLTPEVIELLVGTFLAPLAIALFKQTGWPSSYNAIVAVLVYIVFGVAAVAVKGDPIDVNNLVPTITLITTAGTVAYTAFWRNIGDPQIAAATSVVKDSTPPGFVAPPPPSQP